jgi:hypothetical protein
MRHRGHGLRTLHGEQCPVVGAQQPDIAGQLRRDMGEVGVLARGVDHQHQHAVLVRIGRARHHEVVENAAVRVEQLGVALAPRREADDVRRHQRLQRAGDAFMIGPDQEALAHMGDVEQAGGAAGVGVLGDDAVRILDRHVIARERHHAGATREMQPVQWGGGERLGLGFAHLGSAHDRLTRAVARPSPLCRGNLRDFAGTSGLLRR